MKRNVLPAGQEGFENYIDLNSLKEEHGPAIVA